MTRSAQARTDAPAHTNALANETSPYLLQHAHNPVDWMPWGPAAFERARSEDKPLLVSIGYSTCYWCHVMERQCFEDEEIAALMNRHFVCIKVDREERPDVDDVYMTATQLVTRSGGWPMNAFVTPTGLKPFMAGTYFPPEPAHGRPSWPQVLEGIAQAWREQREEVEAQADRLAAAVRDRLSRAFAESTVGMEAAESAGATLDSMYDDRHGGFGGAPKFPTPANLTFLLAMHMREPDERRARIIAHTLDRMARGGIYDQVGGGFHRYSVDERWLVPHFEKMLYDNGQLLSLYATALEAGIEPGIGEGDAQRRVDPQRSEYARVLRETAEYVLREMTDSATGLFYSAQDAEVNAMEGGNYLWTREQVEAALADAFDGDERATLTSLALKMYGLDQGTNFTDPHHPDATPANVLFLATPLDKLADGFAGGDRAAVRRMRERINTALRAVRDGRDQPVTDDKSIVAWNGLMMAGLAEAGRVLGEARYIEAAARAADAILEFLTDAETSPATREGASGADGPARPLLRTLRAGTAKQPAFLEDYAFLVGGLLALHRAGAGDRWLERAGEYQRLAADLFSEDTTRGAGGYFDTRADQTELFVRTHGVYDGAIASANAQMIHNLLGLYEADGDRGWLDRAVTDLRAHGEAMERAPAGMVHMLHALLRAWPLASERLAEPGDPGEAEAAGDDTGPVSLSARRERDGVVLVLEIAPGFHLYGPVGEGSDGSSSGAADGIGEAEGLVPLSVAARDEAGKPLAVSMPGAEPYDSPITEESVGIYRGRVEVRIAGEPQAVWVRYQPCTQSECLDARAFELTLTEG